MYITYARIIHPRKLAKSPCVGGSKVRLQKEDRRDLHFYIYGKFVKASYIAICHPHHNIHSHTSTHLLETLNNKVRCKYISKFTIIKIYFF